MSDSWDTYDPQGDADEPQEDLHGELQDEQAEEPRILKRRRGSNESRGSWYLLTGLVIGLGLGLVYAWVISPVKYTDTSPASLTTAYKDEYRQTIALAYASDRDLTRARERLKLIQADDPAQALAAQAQRMLSEKQPAQSSRALIILAADLGHPPAQLTRTPKVAAGQATVIEGTPAAGATSFATLDTNAAVQTATMPLPTRTPTVTLTPLPTFTPRPSATAIPVTNAPFVLKSKREVCDKGLPTGLLQIQVNDADQKPLPGVRITITWQDGESIFYTGLAPEINPGYADFGMKAGIVYRVRVGELSDIVKDLQSKENCSWRLEFNQN